MRPAGDDFNRQRRLLPQPCRDRQLGRVTLGPAPQVTFPDRPAGVILQRRFARSWEGLNSVFQATKRKARGYRSSEYRITMLYFVAGKLRLPVF